LKSSGWRSAVTLRVAASRDVRKWRLRNVDSQSATHESSFTGSTDRTCVGWCTWYTSDAGPVKPLLPISSSV